MKSIGVVGLLIWGGVARAQAPGSEWLNQSWAKVQREGKSAVDRIVKESPGQFKNIRKQAAVVSKKVETSIKGMDLEGKTRVISELWQVRRSVNLLALANPNVLALVGIDPDQMTGLVKQTNASWANVTKSYPEIVKSLKLPK